MNLNELEKAIQSHSGEFLCEQIGNERKTKIVPFIHIVEPPQKQIEVPTVGRLNEFYEIFGSITFYHDEESGDAGKYLAPPSKWEDLSLGFNDWIELLDEDEREELVPDWVGTCLIVGETPASGNYLLVPTEGSSSGRVFEFEHDGFEFIEEAQDIIKYAEKLLSPDRSVLRDIASHMRFVTENPREQWSIKEMRCANGVVVKM